MGRSGVIYDGRTIASEIRNDCKTNAGCLIHLRTGAYVKKMVEQCGYAGAGTINRRLLNNESN